MRHHVGDTPYTQVCKCRYTYVYKKREYISLYTVLSVLCYHYGSLAEVIGSRIILVSENCQSSKKILKMLQFSVFITLKLPLKTLHKTITIEIFLPWYFENCASFISGV